MKKPLSDDKLRGGYYTPSPISRFLANWAVRSASDRVLEPSCGDGAILSAAAERLRELAAPATDADGVLVGVELHSAEANKAHTAAGKLLPQGVRLEVIHGDFFTQAERWGVTDPLFAGQTSFDAIVGNPPFIRYQNFPEDQRTTAFRIMNHIGLSPNRMTNAWAPFLVAATLLLRPGGRLAMVIPAELLQVTYAAEVRQFLSSFVGSVTLVTFKQLLFDNAQQDVVLLLAERTRSKSSAIRVVELDSLECLAEGATLVERAARKRLDHSKEKWTRYFLTPQQITLLRKLEDHHLVKPLAEFAEVDVGVVTGENSFFVLNEEDVTRRELEDYVVPLASRSAQVPGLQFTKRDWRNARLNQDPVHLFVPPDADAEVLPAEVYAYLAEGEARGVHRGYKCRIRKRWYIVPSRWVPDAFGLRQVHDYPRVIVNHAGATATDTLHRIRFAAGVNASQVAAAMVNSLSLGFSEVIGRGYGGGVLTFEPSEFEQLPLPWSPCVSGIDVGEIDALTRAGRIEDALALNDRLLLQDGLGLDANDVRAMKRVWTVLRDRRQGRKVRKARTPANALAKRR